MDFMTEGGPAAEVWWNEQAKWLVLLGQSIPGEVRVRRSGAPSSPGSKIDRLRRTAETYERSMNIYTNNCRTFCARMQREVERMNAENNQDTRPLAGNLIADCRLVVALLAAGTLPLLYPITVALLIYVCV